MNAKARITSWHDIPAGPEIPDVINVIAEIPKGPQNKYEYDKNACTNGHVQDYESNALQL